MFNYTQVSNVKMASHSHSHYFEIYIFAWKHSPEEAWDDKSKGNWIDNTEQATLSLHLYFNVVYCKLGQDFSNLRLKQTLLECRKVEFIAQCKYRKQISLRRIILEMGEHKKTGTNLGHSQSTEFRNKNFKRSKSLGDRRVSWKYYWLTGPISVIRKKSCWIFEDIFLDIEVKGNVWIFEDSLLEVGYYSWE